MNARRPRRLSPALALLACAGLAQAAEIIVPTQMTFSVALATAANGDTITLLPGTYSQNPGFSFANKRLTIRGSTGNPADVILDGANLDRVLSISGAGTDGTIIDSLTIQNGRGPATANASGAGLYMLNTSTIHVWNCVIRNNVQPASEGNGAGLYSENGFNLQVHGVRFENNTTGLNGDGAGAYLTGTDYAAFGGCTFHANIAEVTLTDSGSGGGAAWIDNGEVRFTKCTFTANKAESGGAVYPTTGSIVMMEFCLFDGNIARVGGAFYKPLAAGSGFLRNSILVNNSAQVEGCAFRADTPFEVANCTIANNAVAAGGNFVCSTNSADRRDLVINNCIIWGNTAPDIAPIVLPADAPILRRCIVQEAYSVGNGSAYNTVVNPLFVNAAAGNFKLQASSPAIDAGDSWYAFGPPSDFDGNARAVEIPAAPNTGYSSFGPIVDIGAYEYQIPVACYANCDQSTGTPMLSANDFQCFLNKFAGGCP